MNNVFFVGKSKKITVKVPKNPGIPKKLIFDIKAGLPHTEGNSGNFVLFYFLNSGKF